MREEVEVISAVCENKDIHILFENNVDYMMQSCGDVWDFVKEYYNETRQVPPSDLAEGNTPLAVQVEPLKFSVFVYIVLVGPAPG